MPREFTRADRIADQIQRELAQLIQREVKDPRLGMVNISEVRVTRDFGYADIYITLLSAEELTEESPRSSRALRFCGAHPDSCVVMVRGHLGRAMRLRVVPELRFRFDRLAGQSRHMESLIRQAVESDRQKQGDEGRWRRGLSRRRRGDAVDGVLVVDKPAGQTSNGVLQQVRRQLNAARGAAIPEAWIHSPRVFCRCVSGRRPSLPSRFWRRTRPT